MTPALRREKKRVELLEVALSRCQRIAEDQIMSDEAYDAPPDPRLREIARITQDAFKASIALDADAAPDDGPLNALLNRVQPQETTP